MEQTETKQLLQNIISEIETTDSKMFNNHSTAEKGEVELVVVTDEFIQKLWALVTFYARETEHARTEYKFNREDKSFLESARKTSEKEDMLRELFWFLVKEKYNLWHEANIGIRKNWSIVRCREQNPGEQILRRLGLMGDE